MSLLFVVIGCKRTEIPATPTPDPTPTSPTGGVVNDATQVTASVSGIVLDENNVPIANAVVTSGSATTTTNSNGMFIFQNISLSKENGSVTAVKAGYFKGIRSFKTTEGKNHTVRLQLMQRVLSGTVNAASGGTITSNGGATIIFPTNAFVTITGAAYTGTVNIYSRWIDPTAANLPFVIPGDLRGVNTAGVENILETYGMVGAELTDASGNILKIATGKTATVSFPIPASLSATAPTSIVLWHFDEASARWKENGTATKVGNKYTAQVDKFSFWNVDVPNPNAIILNYTLIISSSNSSLVSATTRIKRTSSSGDNFFITNSSGFASGLVPKNEALTLEVISGCSTIIFSQNIGPFAANTSLGNINVTLPPSQYINFTGTLLNCNSNPVANGYLLFSGGNGNGIFVNPNATGNFSFSILNCTGSNMSYSLQGVDNNASVQGTIITGVALPANGVINLGNITACGITGGTGVYVAGYEYNQNLSGNYIAKIWKNGIGYNLTDGVNDAKAFSVFVSGTDVYVAGYETKIGGIGNNPIRVAKIWKNGISTNLTDGLFFSVVNSIFVAGNDVYAAGSSGYSNGTRGTIWKNGIATYISTRDLNSVFVDGTDVYAVGQETVGNIYNSQPMAAMWKNGIRTYLTPGVGNYTNANSIFVKNGDVYIAGYEQTNYLNFNTSRAKLWKNGVSTNLVNSPAGSNATSVYLAGNDIFVETFEINVNPNGYVEKIWKNGISSNLDLLSYNPSSSFPLNINSIFVFGNDVYKVGQLYNFASVWKNGAPSFLSNYNHSYAMSIFVK